MVTRQKFKLQDKRDNTAGYNCFLELLNSGTV